jgi:hypothetical protein
VNVSYRPTATMHHLAIQPVRCEQPAPGGSGKHHSPAARLLSRRANRLLSPNVDPNNGRHARWCSCMPGYVCEDHRLRF